MARTTTAMPCELKMQELLRIRRENDLILSDNSAAIAEQEDHQGLPSFGFAIHWKSCLEISSNENKCKRCKPEDIFQREELIKHAG